MAKEVYDYKTIYGKLGNLIDQTPRESLDGHSIGMTLFDIWHHGRTILIGDAVHQVLQQPYIKFSHANISAALKDFTDQRFPQVRAHFIQGSMNASYKNLFIYNVLCKLKSGRIPGEAAMQKRSNEASASPRCKYLPLAHEDGKAHA
ncbi:hypothetical protein BGZ75_001697 [Mortierella antarctica]|nr:hypothetical protein BGZ75_001697 [Mortierella antarctica]